MSSPWFVITFIQCDVGHWQSWVSYVTHLIISSNISTCYMKIQQNVEVSTEFGPLTSSFELNFDIRVIGLHHFMSTHLIEHFYLVIWSYDHDLQKYSDKVWVTECWHLISRCDLDILHSLRPCTRNTYSPPWALIWSKMKIIKSSLWPLIATLTFDLVIIVLYATHLLISDHF